MATYFVNRKAGLFYETKPPVTGSKKKNKKVKKRLDLYTKSVVAYRYKK